MTVRWRDSSPSCVCGSLPQPQLSAPYCTIKRLASPLTTSGSPAADCWLSTPAPATPPSTSTRWPPWPTSKSTGRASSPSQTLSPGKQRFVESWKWMTPINGYSTAWSSHDKGKNVEVTQNVDLKDLPCSSAAPHLWKMCCSSFFVSKQTYMRHVFHS